MRRPFSRQRNPDAAQPTRADVCVFHPQRELLVRRFRKTAFYPNPFCRHPRCGQRRRRQIRGNSGTDGGSEYIDRTFYRSRQLGIDIRKLRRIDFQRQCPGRLFRRAPTPVHRHGIFPGRNVKGLRREKRSVVGKLPLCRQCPIIKNSRKPRHLKRRPPNSRRFLRRKRYAALCFFKIESRFRPRKTLGRKSPRRFHAVKPRRFPRERNRSLVAFILKPHHAVA